MSDSEAKRELDELLDRVQEGAKALGAKDYVTKYVEDTKRSIFDLLVASSCDHQSLLRVWAYAIGINHIEKDLASVIRDGAEARKEVMQAPSEPG